MCVSNSKDMMTEKSREQLLREIKQQNPDINIDEIRQIFEAVHKAESQPSNLYLPAASSAADDECKKKPPPNLSDYGKRELLQWSSEVKRTNILMKTENFLNAMPEVIALTKRAIFLATGNIPRDAQLLALFVMLKKKTDLGRLIEVITGEGKTMIIAMLAAILALRNQKVDILSSSSVLAERDATDVKLQRFYTILSLTVSYNDYQKGCANLAKAHKFYAADVLYGELMSFQAGILMTNFKNRNMRNGRTFDAVIVDEVDSMQIDEKKHILRLSFNVPGMDFLHHLLIYIWIRVKEQEINITNDWKNELEEFLKAEIDKNSIPMPDIFKNYAKANVKEWINSAIKIKTNVYQENVDYKKANKKIQIIDYENTGVIHKAMHWQNCVHEFIQLKHGKSLTTDTLITCFMSQFAFFQLYNANIYGLSGTMGSQTEQGFLQTNYKIDICTIPTYKIKRLEEYPGIIARNENEWIQAISNRICETLENKRAVLVINKTIRSANEIEEKLKNVTEINNKQIIMYRDNNEKRAIERVLKPGDVIISTNISGRGTDLIISDELDNNGGLHVIVTFLPKNKRVWKQSAGRAGRQGRKGSAELIINQEEYSNMGNTIAELENNRGRSEKFSLENFYKNEFPRIKLLDHLYKMMETMMKELHLTSNLTGMQNENERSASEEYQQILEQLEELFGYFLKELERKNEENLKIEDRWNLADASEKLEKKMKGWRCEIDNIKKWNDFGNLDFFKNPAYLIRWGNIYLRKKIISVVELNNSIKMYSKAIKLEKESDFAFLAFYYRALARIRLSQTKSGGKKEDEQHKALADLQRTKEALILIFAICLRNKAFFNHIDEKIKKDENDKICGSDVYIQNENKAELIIIVYHKVQDAIKIVEEFLDGKNQSKKCSAVWKKNIPLRKMYNVNFRIPYDEIMYMELFGLENLFILEGMSQTPWPSISFLALMSLFQLGLAWYTFGTAQIFWSTALLAEGCRDILLMIKKYYSGEDLRFMEYAASKALDYSFAYLMLNWTNFGKNELIQAGQTIRTTVTKYSKAFMKNPANVAFAGCEITGDFLGIALPKISEPKKQAKYRLIYECLDDLFDSPFDTTEEKVGVEKQQIKAEPKRRPKFEQKIYEFVHRRFNSNRKFCNKLILYNAFVKWDNSTDYEDALMGIMESYAYPIFSKVNELGEEINNFLVKGKEKNVEQQKSEIEQQIKNEIYPLVEECCDIYMEHFKEKMEPEIYKKWEQQFIGYLTPNIPAGPQLENIKQILEEQNLLAFLNLREPFAEADIPRVELYQYEEQYRETIIKSAKKLENDLVNSMRFFNENIVEKLFQTLFNSMRTMLYNSVYDERTGQLKRMATSIAKIKEEMLKNAENGNTDEEMGVKMHECAFNSITIKWTTVPLINNWVDLGINCTRIGVNILTNDSLNKSNYKDCSHEQIEVHFKCFKCEASMIEVFGFSSQGKNNKPKDAKEQLYCVRKECRNVIDKNHVEKLFETMWRETEQYNVLNRNCSHWAQEFYIRLASV